MNYSTRHKQSSPLRFTALSLAIAASVGLANAQQPGDTISVVETPQHDIITKTVIDRLSFTVERHAAPSSHKFYMAAKTNMLYDLAAVPNIGVEFYVGKNFSVGANWMYAWWDNNSRHRYWRIYGGDLNLRYWFGKAAHAKPLSGHHIGVYAGAVTYDFEWGGTGIMGGKPHGTIWDRCQLQTGVEYGYSLPVGRHLNIDFTIGFGYLGGKYIKYQPDSNGSGYIWRSSHNLHWFGPTKAEISLVWLIGNGNYNAKKGADL